MIFQTDISNATLSLQAALDTLNREIAQYPTPVSGCDQQYTYLLATRHRVSDALNTLNLDVFVATPRSLSPGTGVESR